MQNRPVRFTILTVLIIVGIGAAYLSWSAQRESASALTRHQQLDSRLDTLLADLAELGAAQQAYVAPGQIGGPWLARVTLLLQRLYDDAGSVRGSARSAGAAARLQAFGAGLDALLNVDTRIREYLRQGDELKAADLTFGEAREKIAALNAGLRELRSAERALQQSEARAFVTREASVAGGAAAAWLLGLVLLSFAPRPRVQPASIASPVEQREDTAGVNAATGDAALDARVPGVMRVADSRPPEANAPIDLARAAEVCADLACLGDASRLSATLAKASGVLDAAGLIVWLGAGEQLFAVTSDGYDPRVITRLGPIERRAENATAEAWRDARLRTVAGDATTNGAIVAPMIGIDGCRGVLAVEVRNGREDDAAARAVTTMFAAQLAGILASWPAASAGAAPADERAS